MSSIPELDVQRALPEVSDKALAKFLTVNPNWRGAEWADCLSVLCDSDSNLEVSEPLWEALSADGFITDDTRRFITPVTLTLYYGGEGEVPTPQAVRIGVNMTRAYLGLIEGEWQQ